MQQVAKRILIEINHRLKTLLDVGLDILPSTGLQIH